MLVGCRRYGPDIQVRISVVNKDFNKPGVFLTFTSTLAGYLDLDSMIIIEYNGSKKVGESTTVLVNGSAQIAMIKGMTKINNN